MSEDEDEDEIRILRKRTHDLANALAVEREERKRFEADLVGASGNNGKVGTLRGSVGAMRAALVAIAMVALGGLGTGVGAVYTLGERKGREQFRLDSLEAQVASNTTELRALSVWAEVMRLRLQGGNPP